ncbi:hypothetical protein MYSTI_02524 [Myxococcus stipitatus DSM 14675]|uniref:Uncharacterized protein n=1 Tax=Myxococcus stipitatus (strain DSM 14675 / JCM 12634 / Mx s8) TaxID=1278073 RepID=L7U7P0_MYXSD|nr:hypothetical protein [Myxococcus stipitatus]AGC43840.1 hypothetical protein MYSTI_02524 [Myxococcus stipitatus DSM 14675]
MSSPKYTPAETAALREQFLQKMIEPVVRRCFQRHPSLRSALFLVAQYWNDEADDAVHHELIFSQRETPDVEAASNAAREGEDDTVNLAAPMAAPFWDPLTTPYVDAWPDNHEAIPVFAAFTREDCHQEMSILEAYAPYALFRRAGEDLSVEVVGQMLRPWLDGVRATWDAPE